MNARYQLRATLLSALLTSLLLSACGGGGSSGSDNSGSSNTGGASSGGTGGSTGGSSGGNTGGSSGGTGSGGTASSPVNSSGLNALFLGNQFDVYVPAAAGVSSNAGAIDRSNTQGLGWSLGGSASTVLTVLGTDFGLSATGFTALNRSDASVIMLCSGMPLKAVYVGVVTQANAGGAQASRLSRATDLAGQSFYRIEDCSYTNKDGESSNQSSGATASSLRYSVDASGNLSGNDGSSATAAELNTLLAGGTLPVAGGAGKMYLTAYTFQIKGVSRYVLVSRGMPNSGSGGYVDLWVQN